MKRLFSVFLLWVFIINAFALITFNRFSLQGDSAYTWQDPTAYSQEQSWNIVDLHARWDSEWYIDIAKNGYSYTGGLSNIVFFPFYPALIKAFSFLTFGNLILSGWIVSLLFLFLALIYFRKLVLEFHPNIDPAAAIVSLLIFPTAFFFNAVYTESLFLFLSIASFYYSFRRNFLLGGLFGFLAALTRVTGVFLFIPLSWEFFQAYRSKKVSLSSAFALLLVPMGTLLFFLFHFLKFGDFFLWLKVEEAWGRNFSLNESHFILTDGPKIANFSLDLFFVFFALIMTFWAFKKLRISYGLYMISTILIALASGTTMSINRYILVLFPLYILLGNVREPIRQAISFVSILLLALYTILFANNYWAG
jgi:hypothetical protein